MLPPENLPNQLSTIRANVKSILLAIPSSRSNDKVLLIEYLKTFCGHALIYDPVARRLLFKERQGITYEDFLKLPSFESIARFRRFIQKEAKDRIEAGIGDDEDASLLPSNKVAYQRELLEMENRHYYMVRN